MAQFIDILRAGPLVTVQDPGRAGALGYGISASGPMDQSGFVSAGAGFDARARSGLEFTMAGLEFRVEGTQLEAGFAGGAFILTINGTQQAWPCRTILEPGDVVAITPGAAGVYGYVRFDHELDVPLVLGSRATNLIVGLGGFEGRALKAGDRIGLVPGEVPNVTVPVLAPQLGSDEPIRVTWGIHAELFTPETRSAFTAAQFGVSRRLDRMGIRLDDPDRVFADSRHLSLVSDSVVPGDIQILGDGTPIVLMRDHQPTGGYARIGTVISADLDRLAQMRPGTKIRFESVTVAHAQKALRP